MRCNVQIGVRPCASLNSAYMGRNCLYINKPFYHAFVCAKCVNQLHGQEQNVQRCLETENNNRFSILRTGSGFSVSVTRGKGHDGYNTVRILALRQRQSTAHTYAIGRPAQAIQAQSLPRR